MPRDASRPIANQLVRILAGAQSRPPQQKNKHSDGRRGGTSFLVQRARRGSGGARAARRVPLLRHDAQGRLRGGVQGGEGRGFAARHAYAGALRAASPAAALLANTRSPTLKTTAPSLQAFMDCGEKSDKGAHEMQACLPFVSFLGDVSALLFDAPPCCLLQVRAAQQTRSHMETPTHHHRKHPQSSRRCRAAWRRTRRCLTACSTR